MKKVLITGSSRGIGAAITDRLLKNKVQVVGVARRHPKIQDNYLPYIIDCAELKGLEEAFKAIRAEHTDIDALICCCGYGHFSELEQFSFLQMQALMNVNFMSQALVVKTFMPLLKKRHQAKIVMLGSECALTGQRKGALYCASKFALRGFVQSIRQECRSANVAITLVNPGMVDTDFFEHLDFKPGLDKAHSIAPEQVAEMIDMVLALNNNCVVEEINCQPMAKVIIKK